MVQIMDMMSPVDAEPRTPTRDCRTCPLVAATEWRVLSDPQLAVLSAAHSEQSLQTGDILYRQGDQPSGIYCLRRGTMMFKRRSPHGHDTPFGLVRHGETIGLRGLFGARGHGETAVALSECRTCTVPAQAVMDLLADNEALALDFLKSIARDRGPVDVQLFHNPKLPVHIRLIHLLLSLKDQCATPEPPDGLRYNLPIRRSDIAAMIGARAESVSRAIRELERQQLASFNGRLVRLPDLARVRRAVKLPVGS